MVRTPARSTASSPEPSPRGVGRPPAGGEDKRARILDEAVKLFAVHGYSGASLGGIARAAGISKAGLLHHFPSKETLFAQVLQRRDAAGTTIWSDPVTSPWDLLEAFVAIIEANRSQPSLVQLYSSVAAMAVSADSPAHDWLRGHFTLSVTNLTLRLEEGKAAGTVRADAPSEMMARLVVAAADGLQTQWLCQAADGLEPDAQLDMAAHVRQLVELLRDRWGLG